MEASLATGETGIREDAVQRELAAALIQQARTAQLTAIGIGTVAALLLGMTHRSAPVLLWWLVLVSVSLIRLFTSPIPVEGDTTRPTLRLAAGLVTSGLIWGSLPFIAGQPTAYELALYFIILGGIGAGATTSLAPSRFLLPVFMLPMMSGLLLALLWYTPPYAGYLAATVLLYVVAMSSLHRNQHRLLRDTVETRLQLEASLHELERNQQDRLSLSRRLEETSNWTARYLQVANDVSLDFDLKAQRMMNLLRELLSADGIAFCRSHGRELITVHRMDRRGRLTEGSARAHAALLDGINPEEHLSQRRFPTTSNAASRLLDDEIRAAILVPLMVEERLCGALIIGSRHASPGGLRPVQRELIDLVASWLTVELLRNAAITRLRENRETIARTANSVPALIAFVDTEQRYRYVNQKYADVYGVTQAEITGRPVQDVLTPSTYKLIQPFLRSALQGEPQEFELEAVDPGDPAVGGKVMKVCYNPSRRLDGSVDGIYVLAVDITGDVEERRRLRDKSSRDPLTGLRNRTWFLEQVRHEAANWEEGQNYFLMVIDVDGFKAVNDRFGHLHGDRVLRQIADILRSTAGGDDMLVRIGGDEFLLVIRSMEKSSAETVAQVMIDAVNALEIDIRGEPVHLGLSVGIARIDRRFGFKAAYRRADEALYASKQRGRNRFTVHYE